MGTVIDPVEMSALLLQEILHLLVNLMNQGFWKIPSRHTRLIRDHYRFPFILVQQSNRLTRTGKKMKPFDMVYVSHLFVEGPVPIKKDCLMCHTRLLYSFSKNPKSESRNSKQIPNPNIKIQNDFV
jgi:hypothetical protein